MHIALVSLRPMHHLGRRLEQGEVGVLAAHFRIGGREHPERVGLEQPGMQVVVHELFRNERFVSLHRAHKWAVEESGPLLGICRLATSPAATGSLPTWKTIGIVAVAALAASASVFPVTAIIAT